MTTKKKKKKKKKAHETENGKEKNRKKKLEHYLFPSTSCNCGKEERDLYLIRGKSLQTTRRQSPQ